MKNSLYLFLLFTGFIFLSSFLSGDKDDCVYYFPTSPGTEMELTSYDKKGKATTVVRYKILSKQGANVKVQSETYNASKPDEVLGKAESEVTCINGVYKFKLGSFSLMGSNQQMAKGMEMKVEGDFVEIPANPQPGQNLGAGSFKIQMLSGGTALASTNYTIKNRKVEGLEKITTPAGTFDCVKISSEAEMKMLIKVEVKAVEWFAKDVGLVRTESYNKAGKMEGYSQLTKFKK